MIRFLEWLQVGIDAGWVSDQTCMTHDMAPMTEAEYDAEEAGEDPCIFIVRLWGPEGAPA